MLRCPGRSQRDLPATRKSKKEEQKRKERPRQEDRGEGPGGEAGDWLRTEHGKAAPSSGSHRSASTRGHLEQRRTRRQQDSADGALRRDQQEMPANTGGEMAAEQLRKKKGRRQECDAQGPCKLERPSRAERKPGPGSAECEDPTPGACPRSIEVPQGTRANGASSAGLADRLQVRRGPASAISRRTCASACTSSDKAPFGGSSWRSRSERHARRIV